MRNIPIEFEITNDQLASMETTDIESFLYETIRENISAQLLNQLEDDSFIDISPTDASYKVTCNLVLGSQKEFYSAITDVAKELIARQYNESVTNRILSPLYKLMGEEPKDNDAEEIYHSTGESEQVYQNNTNNLAQDIIDESERIELKNRLTMTQSEFEQLYVQNAERLPPYERIKNLLKGRGDENLLNLIHIANNQGYIEFNNIQAGCLSVTFRKLIKEALPAFYEQHKSIIEGTTND